MGVTHGNIGDSKVAPLKIPPCVGDDLQTLLMTTELLIQLANSLAGHSISPSQQLFAEHITLERVPGDLVKFQELPSLLDFIYFLALYVFLPKS